MRPRWVSMLSGKLTCSHGARAGVGLDVDVVHAELGAPVERRLQLVHGRRQQQTFDDEVVIAGGGGRRPGDIAGIPHRADAVETCCGDARDVVGEGFVGLALEVPHGPQGLEDEELLRHGQTLPTRSLPRKRQPPLPILKKKQRFPLSRK